MFEHSIKIESIGNCYILFYENLGLLAKEYNVSPDGKAFYTDEVNELFEQQLIDEANGKFDK